MENSFGVLWMNFIYFYKNLVTERCLYLVENSIPDRHPFSDWFYYPNLIDLGLTSREISVYSTFDVTEIVTNRLCGVKVSEYRTG